MYQVLYRKWRPKVFADVVGQEHITGTLLSQLRENKVAHAYLFTGSRGTGKTTCAKILAKAVNCLSPVDGEPCGRCEMCRSIDDGSNLDVVEMDAASNRNLDDIKELLDEINYPPSNSRYRVYIIDEVHMLTTFAFNAILKTLEEPPEYVRFVLATTEVQKMPATILSRCQRFDFRRIEPDVIAKRLMFVAGREGGSVDEDAGEYIAKLADGGMRDSLSLLDRCLSITNHVTSEVVSECAGLVGREYIYEIMRAVGNRDAAGVLGILDRLHRNSCDTERLCSDVIEAFRNVLVLKTVERPERLIVCTASELGTLRETASMFSDEAVVHALQVLSDVAERMRNSQNRRIEAEMAFIRLCRPEAESDVAALASRVAELEKQLAALKSGGFVPDKTNRAAPAARPAPAPKAPAPVRQPPVTEPAERTPVREEKKSAPSAQPFSGFAAELSASAQPFDGPDDASDDAPLDGAFDFDKFMAEAAQLQGVAQSAPAETSVPSDDYGDEVPLDELEPPFDESGPVFDEPEPPFEDEPAPAFTAPPAPAAAYGAVPAGLWSEVIKEVEASNHALICQLEGSRAEIRGGTLVISGARNLFVSDSTAAAAITPVAQRLLGKKFAISIVK